MGKQVSVKKNHIAIDKERELKTYYFVHFSELLRSIYFAINFVNPSFSCCLSLNSIYTASAGNRNAIRFHLDRD